MKNHTVSVVINACYGGFSLSTEGVVHYAKLKGITVYPEPDEKFRSLTNYWTVPPEKRPPRQDNWNEMTPEERVASNEAWRRATLTDRDIPRDDPALVQTVKELGERANGACAKLEIVEVPADAEWEIEEYDGNEHVAEKHRTWR